VQRGSLARDAGRYRLASFQLELDPGQRAAAQRIEQAAQRAGLTMEPLHSLVAISAHPDGEDLVHHLVAQGRLARVGGFAGHQAVLDPLQEEVRAWLRSEGSFTPSQAKERWGLTRKHLIPLLEWLDAQRVTRRVGDSRRACR